MTVSGREPTVNLAGSTAIGNAAAAVAAIHAGYERYHRGFQEITRRARGRFEQRDWLGAQADATERLTLYKVHLDGAVSDVRDILQDAVMERTLWASMKALHAVGTRGRADAELEQTFFNSVTRRVFTTVGVDPGIEYLEPARRTEPSDSSELYETHSADAVDPALVRRMLDRLSWSVPYASLDRDAGIVARLIDRALEDLPVTGPVSIDVVRSVFYRNKGAYLVGRIRQGGMTVPLVLPLLRSARGIVVDAALLTQNEVSIVFGFSWSYFRVEAPRPRALIEFLCSIMPL
jgi:isocitrate dehydrogenase kinase/phosphatase